MLSYPAGVSAEDVFLNGLELQVGTEFPVNIGARVDFRFPYGILAGGGVGWMPLGYVKTINSTMIAMDMYDNNAAFLVESTISDSLFIEFEMGWDPMEKGGFFFDLGYAAMLVGGTKARNSLIADVTGAELLFAQRDAQTEISTMLHNFTAHVGYEFYFTRNWTLTLAAGMIKTFTSYTSTRFSEKSHRSDEAEKEINEYMDDFYTKHFLLPTFVVRVGYDFL